MEHFTDIEILLLMLLRSEGSLSGYELNRIVEERGYRKKINIATSSIYATLQKLKKKELVSSRIGEKKSEKGPLPKEFTILNRGKELLTEEIQQIIASADERSTRFEIGLTAMSALTKGELLYALRKRKELLIKKQVEIKKEYVNSGGAEMNIAKRYLFKHQWGMIKFEIKFTTSLVEDIK